MKKLQTVLILVIAYYAAATMVGHEKPTRIMFNPDTDGPILAEKQVLGVPTGLSGICMTSVPINGGSSGVPVFTPCSLPSTTARPQLSSP